MSRATDEILTQAELAQRLKVSVRTIIRWRGRGFVPTYGGGRAPRFRWRDVLAAIRQKALLFGGAENPVAAYEALESVYGSLRAGERLVIGPIGTKPHGIGAALFACAHPDAGFIYDYPKRRAGRTKKISVWHLFRVDSGALA